MLRSGICAFEQYYIQYVLSSTAGRMYPFDTRGGHRMCDVYYEGVVRYWVGESRKTLT